MGVHWKIRFLGRLSKKVAWTVCRFKRGLGKKTGLCFWGGLIPQCIYLRGSDTQIPLCIYIWRKRPRPSVQSKEKLKLCSFEWSYWKAWNFPSNEESTAEDHLLTTYPKFFEKLIFLTPWYAHVLEWNEKSFYFFHWVIWNKCLFNYLSTNLYNLSNNHSVYFSFDICFYLYILFHCELSLVLKKNSNVAGTWFQTNCRKILVLNINSH